MLSTENGEDNINIKSTISEIVFDKVYKIITI